MKGDNSKLAADCSQWHHKTWGNSNKGQNRYRVVAFVNGKYHWLFEGSSRWECDDYNSNGAEYFGFSTGDLTIVASSMRNMIQNGARQKIQTQHYITRHSLPFHGQYNITQCKSMSMNKKGAFLHRPIKELVSQNLQPFEST